MKVYIGKNKIILCGKAWEIKAKLQEYRQNYHYVYHWINK
ncbi:MULTISPECIES: Z-ring formation inhibitor MciZ [Bacillus]|nr:MULTISPECIES: Z-ring formation inhibitor MciZ [Bacillus]